MTTPIEIYSPTPGVYMIGRLDAYRSNDNWKVYAPVSGCEGVFTSEAAAKEVVEKLFPKLAEGQKVKFLEEKQRYTVQAASDRFAVCTKPMNALKTVLYTIVDFRRGIRGVDNLVFGHGYETKEDCKDALKMLEDGDMEVSWRQAKHIPLVIEAVS